MIRANGIANLFVLNPNGIIFGSNASLNIGGSFIGSTASSLKFADNTQLNATSTQTTPLLTVSVPIGLQFGNNPGRILVQGNGQGIRTTTELIDTTTGLRVQPNKTLALVGGDVALEGGTLKTVGGQIELGSVSEPSLVNLTPISSGWAFGYQSVPTFGKIQLSEQATIDASGVGGGNIQVQGRRVSLTNGSQIETSTLEAEPGGTLAITATESVELIGASIDAQVPSGLVSAVYPKATGTGGNLTLDTRRLSIRDGGKIQVNTSGAGSAGSILVNALESVEVIGSTADGSLTSGIFGRVRRGATGNGGNLTINTGRLSIRDGGEISASTFGTGSAGSILVNALESAELIGTRVNGLFPSSLFGIVNSEATGNGGNLTINTGRLSVRDGGQISVSTAGAGSAGNLLVNALESAELIGTSADGSLSSGLFGRVRKGATGNGGNLTVNTKRLSVRDRGKISVSTFSTGSAGSILVNALESVELIGSTTDDLNLTGLGARSSSAGNAGDLKIETGRLSVQDGAQVSVSSESSGKTGQFQIQASSIQLNNQAKLNAESYSGEGGDISLRSQNLQLRRGSNITATADNRGDGGNINGGNININTDLLTVLERSNITADAFQGRGGNIRINTQGFFRSPDSKISASSNFGINGTVQINTLVTNPNNGLVELPSVPINILGLVAQGCRDGSGAKGASFVITGRGGLPRQPSDPLRVDAVRVAGATEAQTENRLVAINSQTTRPESSAGLVEANSWIVNSKGDVILLAQPSQPSIAKSSDSTLTCYAP